MQSWVFGAAIISANSDFRDQHKHLGWIGRINSWFIGMVMFWLMFNYGLMSAIVAHILYDACIFTCRGALLAFQPRRYLRRMSLHRTAFAHRTAREVELDWEKRMRRS